MKSYIKSELPHQNPPQTQYQPPPPKKQRTNKYKPALETSSEEEEEDNAMSTEPDFTRDDYEEILESEMKAFENIKFTKADSQNPHLKFKKLWKLNQTKNFKTITYLARKTLVIAGSNAR